MNEPRIGVALMKCFLCLEDGDIIMNTKLTEHHAKKVEELNGKASPHAEPCNKCKELMKQGVIIITYDPEKSGPEVGDFWRTGGWFVLKDEAVERMAEVMNEQGKKVVEQAIEKRVLFLPDEFARAFGLFEAAENAPQG